MTLRIESSGSALPTDPNFNTVGIKDVSTDYYLKLAADSNSNFSEDRTLTFLMGDSDYSLTIAGNSTIDQDVSQSGSPLFTNVSIGNSGGIRTGTTAGNTVLFQARDVDGAAWTTFATLTANNTPTFDIAAATTFGGKLLSSGTYTPTATNVTNVAASTVQDAQYIRFGNVVTVSGRLTIDPTSASVATEVGLSLPFASTTGFFTMVSGTCNSSNAVSISAGVEADITNNRAAIRYVNTTDTANRVFQYTYTYLIV